MKRYIIFIILLNVFNSYGTTFTWTGSVDTVFTNSSNWSSSGSPGYPGSTDTAIISNTSTNRPVLAANQDVYNFTLGSSATFDLKNYTFTVQGYADVRGTVNNGTLELRGQSAVIKSTAYINSILDIETYSIELDGGTFMKRCLIEMIGTVSCSGDGGCTFNDEVTIVNSSSSGASIKLSTINGDVFNHDLLLYVKNRGAIYVSNEDSSYFNGNIYVNNEGSMSIIFGDGGGVSYLDSGKVITVGDSGYVANGLYLSNFYQLGTAEQELVLSGTASLFISNCEFDAVSTFSSPDILVSTSVFNDSTTIVKSDGGTNNWYGENIFNGQVNILNQSDYNLRLSNVIGNIFNGNADFHTETAIIDVDYTDTTEFRANVNINSSDVFFRNCVIFNGTDDQFVDGNEGYRFKELTINKPGSSVEIDTSIFVTDTLKLTSGYIYGDSTGVIIMDSSSAYNGGSIGSFIDCQMKKIGNVAFTFPLGQDSIYRPLSISAPSLNSDAFIAEYIGGSQNISDSLDTVLTAVSYCNYWKLLRANGTSTVNMTIGWDSTYCSLFSTDSMRIAKWDSTKWVDKGNSTISGSSTNGSFTLNSVSQFGYFTIATIATQASCPVHTNFSWVSTNATTVTGSSSFPLSPGQTIRISGTFTVDKDFEISGGTILMEDDAKINILSEKTLKIYNMVIKPCGNYQWDYIKINGPTVNLAAATLIVQQTHLIGADSAIWSSAGGRFFISRGVYINRCYKGIMVDSYGSTHPSSIQNSWIDCAKPPGSTNATTLFNPHPGIRTLYGIHISSATNITIGSLISVREDVEFFNMNIGIHSIGTTTSIRNCNFRKMDTNGIAVNATSNSGIYTLYVGGTPLTSCNFTECTYGINSAKMNSFASFNEFYKVDNGIKATLAPNRDFAFNYNSMKYFNKGISVTKSRGAEIVIQANQFNSVNSVALPPVLSFYGTIAIEVLNPSFGITDVSILNNYIANTRTGIKVSNIEHSLTTTNAIIQNIINWDIEPNDLQFNISNKVHRGIYITNGYKTTVNFNIINRPGYPDAINGTEIGEVFGIQTSFLDEAFFGSNDFNHISHGLNLRDECMLCIPACNVFYLCNRGWDFGACLGVPPSGTSVSLSPTFQSRARECFATNSVIINNRVYGWSTNTVEVYHLPGITTSSCEYPANSNSLNVNLKPLTAFHMCPDPVLSFERDALLGPIVNDTVQYSDYVNQRYYLGLDYAYRTLARDTNRLHIDPNKDTLYINFFSYYKNSNIGKYFHIESLINNGDFDTAEDSLFAIVDTNTYEYNRKMTLAVFLEKIAHEDTLDSDDIDSLEIIAFQCPMIGGPAVYEARAMLELDVEDTCMTSQPRYLYNESSEYNKPSNEISLVPNPANDYISITFENEDSAEIEIYDSIGSLLRTIGVPKTLLYNMDVSYLKSGNYLFRVLKNSGITESFKIVINR